MARLVQESRKGAQGAGAQHMHRRSVPARPSMPQVLSIPPEGAPVLPLILLGDAINSTAGSTGSTLNEPHVGTEQCVQLIRHTQVSQMWHHGVRALPAGNLGGTDYRVVRRHCPAGNNVQPVKAVTAAITPQRGKAGVQHLADQGVR